VSVVLTHALLEEMSSIVKIKYIKHSTHDCNAPKNSEVSGGRFPKADRYGAFLISSFHRVLNVACNLLGCSPACGV
jgi:hypothetical protein